MIHYIDKKNTYINHTVEIGDGTKIYPNVVIEGNTKIGKNCTIGMGTYIKDSIIQDNTIIYASHIMESKIGFNCNIGPYSHIRPGNNIKDGVKIGSFVEVKKSTIEKGTKIPHLSYIGDSMIGENVNIGCGVITANYDGKQKHQTIIEKDVFVGCNTVFIAPIKVSKNSFIAAGTIVVKNIPNNSFVISRVPMVVKNHEEEC